jgi:hypothetical protein
MAVFENLVISRQIGRARTQPKVCILHPLGTTGGSGFKKMLSQKFRTKQQLQRLHAQGAWIIKPGQTIVLPSCDCLQSFVPNQAWVYGKTYR